MQNNNYIRFRLKVSNRIITITHVKAIESELLKIKTLHIGEGLLYEIRLGKKRLDIDAIPYKGLYPDGLTIKEKAKEDLENYNFHIRIRNSDINMQTIEKIKIEVYNILKPFINTTFSEKKIVSQFPKRLNRIAKLRGIKFKALSDEVKQELVKILS